MRFIVAVEFEDGSFGYALREEEVDPDYPLVWYTVEKEEASYFRIDEVGDALQRFLRDVIRACRNIKERPAFEFRVISV